MDTFKIQWASLFLILNQDEDNMSIEKATFNLSMLKTGFYHLSAQKTAFAVQSIPKKYDLFNLWENEKQNEALTFKYTTTTSISNCKSFVCRYKMFLFYYKVSYIVNLKSEKKEENSVQCNSKTPSDCAWTCCGNHFNSIQEIRQLRKSFIWRMCCLH